jgi:hypothetical protein
MAEVTNDLLYEVLNRVQEDVSLTRGEIRGVREEVSALRGYMSAMQRDIHNLYEQMHTQGTRLDRIERRLELSDAHS